MAVEPFLPRRLEESQLQHYRNLTRQLQEYATSQGTIERSQALVKRYAKHPWMSPGVALSYEKWKETVGPRAARDLARVAYKTATGPDAVTNADPAAQTGPASFARSGVQEALDDFIATKDFQRQVNSWRKKQEGDDDGGFLSSLVDVVKKPITAPYRFGKGVYEGDIGAAAGAAFDVTPVGSMVNMARGMAAVEGAALAPLGDAPVIGDPLKTASRATFATLESGQQEVQAGFMDAVTGFIGPVGDQAKPLDPNSEASKLGAVTRTPDWEPTSVGAMAIRGYDTGTGWFAGGEAKQAHEEAVRNIASFTYGGQRHFVTPGRLFASTVTEPGTDPFNVLSGSIDALAIIKADPANVALTGIAALRQSRQGFSVADELTAAGGFRNKVRAFVHGPAAVAWADNPNAGGEYFAHVADNIAGRPENLSTWLRQTDYKYPPKLYAQVMDTAPGDRDAVRAAFLPELGTSIKRQPQINSFAARIRNTTHQRALLSEIPTRRVDLSDLQFTSAPLRDLNNFMLGIGLDDAAISRRTSEILTTEVGHARVGRSEAVKHYALMEQDALIAKGVPREMAHAWTSQYFREISGARAYMDREIGTGAHIPGMVIDGTPYPGDKPFLLTEHLGSVIDLPPILGPEGRGQLIARWGNLLGISGTAMGRTGEQVLGPGGKLIELEPEAPGQIMQWLHKGQGGVYRANTAAMHVQASVWKPLALIRFAWTARVIGEEQVRMAMAGVPALLNHPLSYIAIGVAKKKDPNVKLLDWAAEQRALRGSMEGAFNIPEKAGAYRSLKHGQIKDYFPGDARFGEAWADRLTAYSEDDVMRALAEEMSNPNPTMSPLDAMRQRLWEGDLVKSRAELSKSRALLEEGRNMATQEGVDLYIDDLFDRLDYYTQGDPDLIAAIASGKYAPRPSTIAKGRSLEGSEVVYDGEIVSVAAHRKGSPNAKVILTDGNSYDIPVSQLDFLDEGGDLLSRNQDGIALDKEFVAHLASKQQTPEKVSGYLGDLTEEQTKWYDMAVRAAFVGLMDVPATKLNRSHVFLEGFYDEMERLLPRMTPAARVEALAEAKVALMQAHKTGIRHPIQTLQHPLEAALKNKYQRLEDAAARGTGTLTKEEAEIIAKGHSLDKLRDLLYDTHKRNKGLASAQLIAPFGEAWKEMIGSWGRIIVERPQTIRKVQIGVTAAQGANPFSFLPGAVPDYYQDKGFIVNDPAHDGAYMFIYPWSLPFNEALTGVPVAQTGDPMSLSMGFNLIPGIGPAVQFLVTPLLDKFANTKGWDPIRQAIAPYGGPNLSEGVFDAIGKTFAPAWMLKTLTAWAADPKASNQDARALGSVMGDVLDQGAASGEYDMMTREGVAAAMKDAESKARELIFLRGTFQYGAPAAPRFEFFAEDKNKHLIPMSLMRDSLYGLYEDPNTRDNAVQLFIDRYGKRAMYVTAPKTLGTSFGQQFTQTAYDWERDHPELVDRYPLSFPEFAPRAKPGEDAMSYPAWLHAVATGQRKPVPLRERIASVQNVLGSWEYDEFRKQLGLKEGDVGNEADQAALREKRNEIHERQPGFRRVAVDIRRIPAVIDELVAAADDQDIYRSNPTLADSLKRYVTYRNEALKEVEHEGGSTDFNRPGYASAQRFDYVREWLRNKAKMIGRSDPQFLVLFEDTFAREMKDDD